MFLLIAGKEPWMGNEAVGGEGRRTEQGRGRDPRKVEGEDRGIGTNERWRKVEDGGCRTGKVG